MIRKLCLSRTVRLIVVTAALAALWLVAAAPIYQSPCVNLNW
jgi:hypothetical protein